MLIAFVIVIILLRRERLVRMRNGKGGNLWTGFRADRTVMIFIRLYKRRDAQDATDG